MQERLAKLVGWVAIIKAGAATEIDMKEKKARVEDAMHATKAARSKRASTRGRRWRCCAPRVLETRQVADDERMGLKIVLRAIEEPMRWIAINAGHEGLIVVQRVNTLQYEEGFNAQTERHENLVQAGRHRSDQGGRVGDPERRVDLSLPLTTEAVITQLAITLLLWPVGHPPDGAEALCYVIDAH